MRRLGGPPIRGVFAQRHRLGRFALYVPNMRFTHHSCVLICRRPRHAGAWSGHWRLRAESAMDELAIALKIDPRRAAPEMLLRPRPERRLPYTSKQLRNAMIRARRRLAGRSAIPSHVRCATARNLLAGAWQRASGKRCRCPRPCASLSPLTVTRIFLRDLRHRHRHLHHYGAGCGRSLGLPIENISSSFAIPHCPDRRSRADRGLRPRCATLS